MLVISNPQRILKRQCDQAGGLFVACQTPNACSSTTANANFSSAVISAGAEANTTPIHPHTPTTNATSAFLISAAFARRSFNMSSAFSDPDDPHPDYRETLTWFAAAKRFLLRRGRSEASFAGGFCARNSTSPARRASLWRAIEGIRDQTHDGLPLTMDYPEHSGGCSGRTTYLFARRGLPITGLLCTRGTLRNIPLR